MHLALLSNGKVAMWDGFEAAVNSEHTWDPWTGEFDAIPTGRNLFCAGHITLTDGRLLVAGGHVQAYEGTKDTNIFDPKIDTWTRGQDMAVARWYPTATALPDGRVFVVSGDNVTLGPNPDPNTPVPLHQLVEHAAGDLQPGDRHVDGDAQRARAGCRSTRTCSCCRTASCSTPARTA